MEYLIENEDQMQALGAALSSIVCSPAVVFLQGQLGMGKTTLVRGFLTALGSSSRIKSPTYTLVEPYELLSKPYYHFDLYRMKSPEELEELGFRDYLSEHSVCLFEWPEKGAPLLPKPDLNIQIDYGSCALDRNVTISAFNDRAKVWLSALKL